jgi:A/G-specific adenine glycosylase
MIYKENGNLLIEKRMEKDIWQHLFQFPLIETENELNLNEINSIIFNETGLVPYKNSEKLTHILSHQKINARFYFFTEFPEKYSSKYSIIKQSEIQEYPIPRLIDRFLETNII